MTIGSKDKIKNIYFARNSQLKDSINCFSWGIVGIQRRIQVSTATTYPTNFRYLNYADFIYLFLIIYWSAVEKFPLQVFGCLFRKGAYFNEDLLWIITNPVFFKRMKRVDWIISHKWKLLDCRVFAAVKEVSKFLPIIKAKATVFGIDRIYSLRSFDELSKRKQTCNFVAISLKLLDSTSALSCQKQEGTESSPSEVILGNTQVFYIGTFIYISLGLDEHIIVDCAFFKANLQILVVQFGYKCK